MPKSWLVPTCVGMIPVSVDSKTKDITCPHTRGDDPSPERSLTAVVYLSPHAWG